MIRKIRKITLEGTQQPVASDVNLQQSQTDSTDNNALANTDKLNAQSAQNESPFKPEDVDKMSDDDVINYVFINVPQNIDNATRQKLFARADKIRQNRANGTSNYASAKDMVKGVMANAQAYIKNNGGI